MSIHNRMKRVLLYMQQHNQKSVAIYSLAIPEKISILFVLTVNMDQNQIAVVLEQIVNLYSFISFLIRLLVMMMAFSSTLIQVF